jgi:hypothetical protein
MLYLASTKKKGFQGQAKFDALDGVQEKGLDALVKQDISTHLLLCNNYFSNALFFKSK